MSSEGLKMFLFLPQDGEDKKLTESYIAVKQAHINDEIAEKTERVGKYGVIFTTRRTLKEVNEKLKIKGAYLLIELTGNVTSESIAGFFPDTDIDELKSLNLEDLKDSAKWLENELEKALESEDYREAAKIRDKINNKIKK